MNSVRMSTGKMSKMSDSHFIWRINDFSCFSESHDYVFSPYFRFREQDWYLETELSNESGKLSFRIARGQSHGSSPCAQTYRMYIRDRMGKEFWTSPVVREDFSPENCGEPYLESNLSKNESRLTPADVLSLHLTFDSRRMGPPAPQEDFMASEDLCFICTVDVATQTELQPEPSPDDVTPTRAETAEVQTQTCRNLQPNLSCPSGPDGVEILLQNLRDLLRNGQKSDVTLNVKGTEFKVHKNILVSRSSVFEDKFDHDMGEETNVSVKIADCEPEDFELFLVYLYTGRVVENLAAKSAVELYRLAVKYRISELGPYCVQFLLGSFSVESFCDIMSLGLRHCEAELVNAANAFFAKNVKQIIDTDEWMTFNRKNPEDATEIFKKVFSMGRFLPESN